MNFKAAPVSSAITKNYESEFCGSLPLHLVNLIQPYGFLVVLDSIKYTIIQISENVDQHLNISGSDLIGRSLSDFIPEVQYQEFLELINGHQINERIQSVFAFTTLQQEQSFTAIIHPKERYILIELEKLSADAETSFIRLYQQTKHITSLLKQANTTAEISNIAAIELKKLAGFDRVLVYQFDSNWNGNVIAQAKEKDMDDFMDLHFPASDVPKQARELYFKNPYRLIPTCDYKPVRLQPFINPLTHQFTDLSDCNLRSVATVHLEYMANMKIEASMSLPIIIDNQLWGLISCHHKTKMNPGQEKCTALELLSDIIAAQIAAKEREKVILYKAGLHEVHGSIIKKLFTSSSLSDALLKGDTTINDLLGLDGCVIYADGELWENGLTPSQQQIKELVLWLRHNKIDHIYHTNSLVLAYARSEAFADVCSGLIVIPINAEQGEYILGFRQELKQTLKWGGNPDDAIQMEPDGKTYHPRNSFAIYKQNVTKTSIPWQTAEIEAAEYLKSAVMEKIIKERL
jgi:two-component system, chemotaxis family, sensor kinase Cph1